MLVFNKYRNFPYFRSTLRDLKFILDNFIEESKGAVTLATVSVVGYSWSYCLSYPYTIIQVDLFHSPFNPNLFPAFFDLPGHLYFNPGEEISLRLLLEGLKRGDLGSYESPHLTED